MRKLYVDFGKGIDDQVDIAFAGEGVLTNLVLHEDEHVMLYDSSLEVEAIAHQDMSDGRPFWYAIPDWTTQKNTSTVPGLAESA
jgi:hypothetical protein